MPVHSGKGTLRGILSIGALKPTPPESVETLLEESAVCHLIERNLQTVGSRDPLQASPLLGNAPHRLRKAQALHGREVHKQARQTFYFLHCTLKKNAFSE